MLNIIGPTDSIKRLPPESGGGAGAILGQVGELDAVIGQNCMYFIRYGFNEVYEKLFSRGHCGSWK